MSLMAHRRFRAWAASAAGVAVEAGIAVAIGAWQAWDPMLALALGILVAVAAGALGGWVAGGVVALAGWGFFLFYAATDTAVAALTLPAWLAAGVVAGFTSDALRRTQQGRRRATAELLALRTSTPAAVVTVAADDTIASWHPRAEELFGVSTEQAVGAPASLLGADVAGVIDRARAERETVEGESAYEREDGTPLRLSIRAAAVEDGRTKAALPVVVVITDVTEAGALRDELRAERARQDALRRRLPVVLYTHPSGQRQSLSYVSPQFETLLGYSPDDVRGKPDGFGRLVHPEDRERLAAALQEAEQSQQPFRCEYRLLARDGRVVPVRDEATTVRDEAGKPLYVQGFLVDLSERLEFESERERLLAAKREVASESGRRQKRVDFLVDAGEVLASSLDVAAALRRTADFAVREFADWCAVDLVEEDGALARLTASHADGIENADARERALGAEPEADVRTVAKSGRPIIAPGIDPTESGDGRERASVKESRIHVPMVARGHTVGVITFVRRGSGRRYGADDLALAMDVAHRAALVVEVERLHRRVEQEADAARVLAYVADGVFLVDRTGRIGLWNPAAEAITGFPAASMLGRRPADAIPGWESVRERIPSASSAVPAVPATVPLETAAGEKWLSISAVEFFAGTVYAFRDVTEMRRLDELKSEFVATASHELRTPLAAVYGAAQTLRRHDFALDESGRERFLSMIVSESDRLGRIVNEILLANQLDAGRVDLVREPFDAGDLVDRVVESTRSHSPPGISLAVVAPESTPLVAADRDKVRQVLVNLVENAIKYSPDGGRVEVGLEAHDGAVRFYVRDEGLGIPAGEQERIFEKFYRLDPEMTRGVSGTGLGLYICSELVERMGGRIWVESKEGEGSTFSFELPTADAAHARRTDAEPRAARVEG